MKKLKFLMIPVLCALLVVTTMAHTSSGGVYEFANESKIVTFSEDSALTEEQQQLVAERLVYGSPEDSGMQTYAWCWLTGHDLTYNAVTVTTHKKSAYSPRCYEETYEVATCSKCDYMKEELLGGVYIICCPED